MIVNESNHKNEFSELYLPEMTAPGNFTDKVLARISAEESGGFKALPSRMKILTIVFLLLIYCSTGVLIGVQSWKTMSHYALNHKSSETFIMELKKAHHLDSASEIERIIFNTD